MRGRSSTCKADIAHSWAACIKISCCNLVLQARHPLQGEWTYGPVTNRLTGHRLSNASHPISKIPSTLILCTTASNDTEHAIQESRVRLKADRVARSTSPARYILHGQHRYKLSHTENEAHISPSMPCMSTSQCHFALEFQNRLAFCTEAVQLSQDPSRAQRLKCQPLDSPALRPGFVPGLQSTWLCSTSAGSGTEVSLALNLRACHHLSRRFSQCR